MVKLRVKGLDLKSMITFEFRSESTIDCVTQEVAKVFSKLKYCCDVFGILQRICSSSQVENSNVPDGCLDLPEPIIRIHRDLECIGHAAGNETVVSLFEEVRRGIKELPPHYEHRSLLEAVQILEPLSDPILWWAGRQLHSNKGASSTLRDFLGTNEKTTISVTLKSKHEAPPSRDSKVDSDTYNNIMSFIHRRRETMRELEKDDDDSYLMAEWTNPKSLKNTLNGNCGEIKWSF